MTVSKGVGALGGLLIVVMGLLLAYREIQVDGWTMTNTAAVAVQSILLGLMILVNLAVWMVRRE